MIKRFEINIQAATATATVQCGSSDFDVSTVIASLTGLDEPAFLDKCRLITTPGIQYFLSSDGMIKPLPTKTSSKYSWDWQSESWTDQRSLSVAMQDKWNEIKEARNAALNTDLSTPYGVFDANANSQKAITDAVLMLQTMANMGNPITIDFTLADNSTVTLTTSQMIEVGLILGQRTQTVFATGRIKREAIDAATTVAEVEAITW